ncbi:MAG: YcxB family protein [Clostridia bacterium]|nr:YcxB family protein [Clostridia bacterium]
MKCVTKCTPELHKGASKSALTKQWVMMSVWVLLGILLIVVGCCADYGFRTEIINVIFIIWGCALIAIGLIFGLLNIVKINKEMKRNIYNDRNLSFEYDFCEEYFTVTATRGEDKPEVAKVEYGNIWKVKESVKYIYMYMDNVRAFPVDKTLLKMEEIILLRGYLQRGKEQRKYYR